MSKSGQLSHPYKHQSPTSYWRDIHMTWVRYIYLLSLINLFVTAWYYWCLLLYFLIGVLLFIFLFHWVDKISAWGRPAEWKHNPPGDMQASSRSVACSKPAEWEPGCLKLAYRSPGASLGSTHLSISVILLSEVKFGQHICQSALSRYLK